MKPDTVVPTDLIEVGFLRGAYGLQGWVHVQPHSGDADVLRGVRQWWLRQKKTAASPRGSLPDAAALLEISGIRAQGTGLVAKWQGCDDPETAEALKGCSIAVSRSSFPRLPQGQYYWVDLVGARVVNRTGLQLGVVGGLRNNGAHDLLEVLRPAPDGAGGSGDNAGAADGATAGATDGVSDDATVGAGPAPGILLIPMVAAYVDGVELAARRIRVDWEPDW